MKRKYYQYVGLYIFTYAGIGSLYPLIGQYLDSVGFTGIEIGALTAAGTAVGIFASPFWGSRYQHGNNDKRVVFFLCVSAAIMILSLIFIKYFLVFLLLYTIYAFFQIPIMPLSDAMVLEAHIPFGTVRKWGAVGFAIGVFAAGQIADFTTLAIILPLCSLAFIISAILVWRIIKQERRSAIIEKGEAVSGGKETIDLRGDYVALLKNKKFVALLICGFFVSGTNVANSTYFGFLYIDAGGSIAGIGVAFLLMCGSEAPFMAWSEKISSRFTMERMILVSMVFSTARFLWYSTGPTSDLLLATFFLQGMVNGIVLVEFVRYIAKTVEPKVIGMAMTLYQSISFNLSTILCQMVGGALLDYFGAAQVYLFFGIFNVLGVILYVGFGLHKIPTESA